MSGLLRLGAQALSNAQQAINTTGHNISNVSTEGYSRQTVRFETQSPVQRGSSFIGQGARFAGITRNAEAYMSGQIRQFSSSVARMETENGYLARIDQLIASAGSNIGGAIQSFFNATQELASNPAGFPERQALLGQADALLSQAQSVDGVFSGLRDELNTQFRNSVADINRLADGIAMLNNRIQALSGSSTNSQPNDLLDQRDRLLKELAGKIGIQVVLRDDGAADVFVSQGQSLVQGSRSRELEVTSSANDPDLLNAGFQDSPQQYLTDLDGGELQGLRDLRERSLLPGQRRLGVLMMNVATAFNAAHAQGIDLAGVPGAEFFRLDSPAVDGNADNAGSGVLGVTVQDPSQLRPSRYRAAFDGTHWTLTRLADGSSVSGGLGSTISGAGLAAGDLTLNGIDIGVVAGDAKAIATRVTNLVPGVTAAATNTQTGIAFTTVTVANGPADYLLKLDGNVVNYSGPGTATVEDISAAINQMAGYSSSVTNGKLNITKADGSNFTLEESGTQANTQGISLLTTANPDETFFGRVEIRSTGQALVIGGADPGKAGLTTLALNDGGQAFGIDGLKFSLLGGTPTIGDSFEVDPGLSTTQALDLAINDANRIAAAKLDLKIVDLPGTTGTLTINDSELTGSDKFLAESPVTITYTSTAVWGSPGFHVVWGTTSVRIPYNPASSDRNGKLVSIPELGWNFVAKGVPSESDALQVSSAPVARGDNRNALALAALRQAPLAGNGQRRFTEEYSAFVSSIGVAARQASTNLETETNLLQQAEAYLENSSGVNLDEEFSNMLRFQQFYQASAQLIKVADTLFQSLISSL